MLNNVNVKGVYVRSTLSILEGLCEICQNLNVSKH
jgi:hypothetical protein